MGWLFGLILVIVIHIASNYLEMGRHDKTVVLIVVAFVAYILGLIGGMLG